MCPLLFYPDQLTIVYLLFQEMVEIMNGENNMPYSNKKTGYCLPCHLVSPPSFYKNFNTLQICKQIWNSLSFPSGNFLTH